MGFLTFWIVSIVATGLIVRWLAKEAIRVDSKYFDGEPAFFIFSLILPLIPVINIVGVIAIGVVALGEYINQVGTTKIAKKIFFIREKRDKGEKAKEATKGINEVI